MAGALPAAEGTLWTWTVQRFPPKSPPFVPPPDGFQPFAVGHVELADGVRLAAVIDVADLGSLHIGMRLSVERTPDQVPHAREVT
jgi:uncharacterized OB-fold protein